jgi:hypothetical protein
LPPAPPAGPPRYEHSEPRQYLESLAGRRRLEYVEVFDRDRASGPIDHVEGEPISRRIVGSEKRLAFGVGGSSLRDRVSSKERPDALVVGRRMKGAAQDATGKTPSLERGVADGEALARDRESRGVLQAYPRVFASFKATPRD